jgi:hypothetical protein
MIMKISKFYTIGYWLTQKYKTRVQEAGYYTVAKQLRKQGYPLDIALYILLGK